MPYPLHPPRTMKPRRTATKASGGLGVVLGRVADSYLAERLRMAQLVERRWFKIKEENVFRGYIW